MRDRRIVGSMLVTTLTLAALATAALVAWWAVQPPSPADREAASRELVGHIGITGSIADSSLAAARAVGDFGIEEGVRMVPVRLVEELAITIRIETDRDVVLASPPRVCLVGPFWNPLDAGLSDRCWGAPDLAVLVADLLPPDDAGQVTLRAGQPLVVEATLRRGDTRCDYAPGEWRLQVDAQPIVDGASGPRVDVADLPIPVPLESGGMLELLGNHETRYCSYGAAVYRRQGDPPIRSP